MKVDKIWIQTSRNVAMKSIDVNPFSNQCFLMLLVNLVNGHDFTNGNLLYEWKVLAKHLLDIIQTTISLGISVCSFHHVHHVLSCQKVMEWEKVYIKLSHQLQEWQKYLWGHHSTLGVLVALVADLKGKTKSWSNV